MYTFSLDTNPAPLEPIYELAIGKGRLRAEIVRADGTIEQLAWSPNGITDVGLTNMIEVYFHSGTQITTWYTMLISNTSYTALAAGDTMASHGGWTECIAYSESTRQGLTFGAASAKNIATTASSDFTINANSTVVKGIAVTSGSAKSGTSGILWATGLFGSDQTLNTGDILKISYGTGLSQ